eukprot:2318918-Rhodomonas_salina.2
MALGPLLELDGHGPWLLRVRAGGCQEFDSNWTHAQTGRWPDRGCNERSIGSMLRLDGGSLDRG